MTIHKRLSALEDVKPTQVTVVRAIVETDGTVQAAGRTFTSESEFEDHYSDKDVFIIKRVIVEP